MIQKKMSIELIITSDEKKSSKASKGTKRKFNGTKDTLKETRPHRCSNQQCKAQHWTLEESRTKFFVHEGGKSTKCFYCSKSVEFHVENDKWRQASYFTSKKKKLSNEKEPNCCTNEIHKIPFTSKLKNEQESVAQDFESKQLNEDELELFLESLIQQ
jgi:hypothetical protein